MAYIKIFELRPPGSEFFYDPETFLNDLTDQDSKDLIGGLAISQVTVSGGFEILSNNNANFVKNNTAACFSSLNYSTFLRSGINNSRFTISIKTHII